MGRKILFMFLAMIGTMSLHAQKDGVTIGLGESPVTGALLQVKSVTDEISDGDANATQGIGFPRVALVKKDELQPMYTAEEVANLTKAQNMAHKGLVVYNIKEVEAESLAIGLNFWDGEQWIAVSETQSKAVVTFDCSKVRLYGRYFRRSPLTGDNYIILPVTVSKKGDYTIIASTTNGYYFQATGVFNAPGEYEIRLDPMGTPAESGTDKVTFTNNGVPIEPICNFNITVGVATLTYRINNCEDIKVFGEYQTRHEMSAFSNYAEIPVEVLIEGETTWETEMINGIKFVVNQTFDAPGETVLVARAQGSPKKSGKYTYSFKTDGAITNSCSFVVSFFSTLGEFGDPACKCLDIYEERPDISNGEYFLQDCLDPAAEEPVKTFCDITGGGYTLVWSFSEKTAFNLYTPTGRMEMEDEWRFFYDNARGRVTTEDGIINYLDYRLKRSEFQHFPNSTAKPTLKVRICDNPTDMNDEWGLNNYAILTPRSTSENPVERDIISNNRNAPTVGKLWGRNWGVKATTRGWDEYDATTGTGLYSNARYPTHWNFTGQSTTNFEVIPKRPGATDNIMRFSYANNMFGWFGETQPNHHFGKCGVNGDDYSFTPKTCGSSATTTSLRPHSFNNGEGRYLQWFVK